MDTVFVLFLLLLIFIADFIPILRENKKVAIFYGSCLVVGFTILILYSLNVNIYAPNELIVNLFRR